MATVADRRKQMQERIESAKQRAAQAGAGSRFTIEENQTKRIIVLTPWYFMVPMTYHVCFKGDKKFTVFCPLLSGPLVDGKPTPIPGMEDYVCKYCKMPAKELKELEIRAQERFHSEWWDTTLEDGDGAAVITDYAWNRNSPFEAMEVALNEARDDQDNPNLEMTDIAISLTQKGAQTQRAFMAAPKRKPDMKGVEVRSPSQIGEAMLRFRAKELVKEPAILAWLSSFDEGYEVPDGYTLRKKSAKAADDADGVNPLALRSDEEDD